MEKLSSGKKGLLGCRSGQPMSTHLDLQCRPDDLIGRDLIGGELLGRRGCKGRRRTTADYARLRSGRGSDD